VPFAQWSAEQHNDYIHRAQSEIENMGYAPGYAEPGYSDPKRGILFANWNYFPRDIGNLLEKAGFEIEWSDEWTTCEDCGKALRTSPNSYDWQPSYLHAKDSCEFLCLDCAENEMEDILESYENDPRAAFNDHVDPADYGYHKLEGDFESGFHPGQNDDPKKIYARLKAAGHERLLFVIDRVQQFDVSFSIWEKIEDDE